MRFGKAVDNKRLTWSAKNVQIPQLSSFFGAFSGNVTLFLEHAAFPEQHFMARTRCTSWAGGEGGRRSDDIVSHSAR